MEKPLLSPYSLRDKHTMRIEQTSANIFRYNDYIYAQDHLDFRILLKCKKNNLTTKFLKFKLANRHLHNSLVYKKCRIKLLEEEIRAKQ